MKRFLPLFAVLFLLLRPLCDAQAAGAAYGEPGARTQATASYHADGVAPCCADLEDGSLAKLNIAVAALGAGDGKPPFAVPAWIAVQDAVAPGFDARPARGVFFTASSYYARSARIRR